ncbi:efflux RND transporter periplasmic adaptor subunit [Gilvimarinus sp. DA14]|uniref:efflux RND transporter periplasmic adaptor subunit n=1 Tax=Gilvimarinus sp. DA14 TaxID=2956798 RepID=UPI0020B75AC7|nr:efflux RND transporter periplasmic adaptor subunit [Gilvimarinus sp. DA14]UTF60484.1 efflux RND transporter periplasmic adaptor subunit [Gilvimarinus sp. DA14]
MKKFILPVAITLVGVATISVLVLAKPKPVPQPPAEDASLIQIKVAPLAPTQASLNVTVPGTVSPKREITLVAQVSGQVVNVQPGFVDGGFFTADEALLQIDDRDYKAAVIAAEAQLAQAQQRLAEEQGLARQAKREWHDLGDASANELFMRQPQLAAARAQVAAAEADLDMARLNLARTHIRVPYDGRVEQTLVNLGQYVSAGTELARVYDASVVEVRIPLTEEQAALVDLPFAKPHQLAEQPEVTINATVAGHSLQWRGALTRTQAVVDEHTRMFTAVVEVAEPFAQSVPLLPGLFVEAEIQGRALDGVSRLPRAALYQRTQLLTLNGDNEITVSPVKILHKTQEHVWLRTDLPAATLVSLEKQSLTPAGTVVEPLQESTVAEPEQPIDLAVHHSGDKP